MPNIKDMAGKAKNILSNKNTKSANGKGVIENLTDSFKKRREITPTKYAPNGNGVSSAKPLLANSGNYGTYKVPPKPNFSELNKINNSRNKKVKPLPSENGKVINSFPNSKEKAVSSNSGLDIKRYTGGKATLRDTKPSVSSNSGLDIKRYTGGKATLRDTKPSAEATKRVRNKIDFQDVNKGNTFGKLKAGQKIKVDGLQFDPNGSTRLHVKKPTSGLLTGSKVGLGVAGATALGAGAYGLYKNHKDKEKSAYDVVVDSFEKQAGFREDAKNLRAAQKAYRAVKKEKGVVNSMAREDSLKLARAARDSALAEAKKSGKNAIKSRAIPIGAGAGVLGAGATGYGIYKHHKNKQEKSAYDIVIDTFEKRAEEDQNKKKKPIYLVDGAKKGAKIGAALGALGAGAAGLGMGSGSPREALSDAATLAIGGGIGGALNGAFIGTGVNAIRLLDRKTKEDYERKNRR